MERRGYEISEKHTKDILQRLVAGARLANLEGGAGICYRKDEIIHGLSHKMNCVFMSLAEV